jgi:hypothetical protein
MGGGGAQRPFVCVNEPKKTGAYIAQALSEAKTNYRSKRSTQNSYYLSAAKHQDI